jgi:hypothetical protein
MLTVATARSRSRYLVQVRKPAKTSWHAGGKSCEATPKGTIACRKRPHVHAAHIGNIHATIDCAPPDGNGVASFRGNSKGHVSRPLQRTARRRAAGRGLDRQSRMREGSASGVSSRQGLGMVRQGRRGGNDDLVQLVQFGSHASMRPGTLTQRLRSTPWFASPHHHDSEAEPVSNPLRPCLPPHP